MKARNYWIGLATVGVCALCCIGCEPRPSQGQAFLDYLTLPRSPGCLREAKILQQKTAAKLRVPVSLDILIDPDTPISFALIPGGTFYMGSPMYELKRHSDEGPLHKVVISHAFYMSIHEITQQQYHAVKGPGKSFYFAGDKFPAERVSYNQARIFADMVYQKLRLRLRLPTEAEWEYACRSGSITPFHFGESITAEHANFNTKRTYGGAEPSMPLKQTTKVGSYPPNAFGLHDMHGNVWEWCRDRYSKTAYKSHTETNPLGAGKNLSTIIRGGAWNSSPSDCRSANRDHRKSWRHPIYVGFRVVLEIDDRLKAYLNSIRADDK